MSLATQNDIRCAIDEALKGYDAPAGNGIDITVSASAMAKDTVKDFATVLSVITSD